MDPKDFPDKLKKDMTAAKTGVPEGVAPTGPVMDITEATMRSLIAIPAYLDQLGKILDDVSDSLYVISKYFEKKGLKEEVLTPEDIEGDDGGTAETRTT